jgi:hypothetical protein
MHYTHIKFSCLAYTRPHKSSIYLQHQNTLTKDISSKLLHILASLLLRLLFGLRLLLSGLLLLPFNIHIPSKCLVILPSVIPLFRKRRTKASIHVPRMFKSHVRPIVRQTVHNAMITASIEYISYIMTPVSEKDYRASNITTFILSAA